MHNFHFQKKQAVIELFIVIVDVIHDRCLYRWNLTVDIVTSRYGGLAWIFSVLVPTTKLKILQVLTPSDECNLYRHFVVTVSANDPFHAAILWPGCTPQPHRSVSIFSRLQCTFLVGLGGSASGHFNEDVILKKLSSAMQPTIHRTRLRRSPSTTK